MTRADLLASVMHALSELDDPHCYGEGGESRYHDVVGLLQAVDWGVVPADAIRSVFAAIVEAVPLELFERTPYGKTLAEEAESVTESNVECRLEMVRHDERETARAEAGN